MRRSTVKVFVHLIWAVKHREKRLTPDLERDVYRCLSELAQEMGCMVKAIGGTEAHLHMLIWMPTTLTIAEIVKKLKGVSSAMINDKQNHAHHFRWQENYGVYSVSEWNVPQVREYIRHQKQHHAENTVIPRLEADDEELPNLTS